MHASGSVPPAANSWPAPPVTQTTTLVSPLQQTPATPTPTPTDPVSFDPLFTLWNQSDYVRVVLRLPSLSFMAFSSLLS